MKNQNHLLFARRYQKNENENENEKRPTRTTSYRTFITTLLPMNLTLLLCFALLLVFVIADQNQFQNQQQQQQQQQQQHPNHHRIAILIPFLSKSQPIVPSYISFFLQSVGSLSPLIDFFIFHNGQLSPLITTTIETNDSNRSDNDESSSSSSKSSSSQSIIMDIPIPKNVQFINLQNMTHYTSHFLQIMNVKRYHNEQSKEEKEDKEEVEQRYKMIHKYYTHFLLNNPYLLIELKPALGYIFQQYINKPIQSYSNSNNSSSNYYYYTHWGYSDLDIFFGDMLSWITTDELENYDIVTYSFGDQERVYLRGQFTFHKNDVPLLLDNNNHHHHHHSSYDEEPKNTNSKQIYMLWTQCDYLYHFNDRFMNLIKNHQFHIQSAEGCYSSVVISSSKEKKLKVKYAVKAFTNPKDNHSMNEYGVSTIFLNNNNNNDNDYNKRNILLKKGNSSTGREYLHYLLSKVNTTSILSSSNDLPLVMQWEVGNKTLIKTIGEGANCMRWAPQQYQYNLCIDPNANVTNRDTIFLIDGELYKQSFEEIGDLFFLSKEYQRTLVQNINNGGTYNNIMESKSFFHIQEWKRHYRTSQVSPLNIPKDEIIGWSFFPEGVVPLFDQSTWQQNQRRIQPAKNLWHNFSYSMIGSYNPSHHDKNFRLPSQHYCVQLKKEKQNGQYKDNCKWAISWIDKEVYKIIGSDWGYRKNDNHTDDGDDVTLTLTLQINTSMTSNDKSTEFVNDKNLKKSLSVLATNLSIWNNQPYIVVICIVGNRSNDVFLEITDWVNNYLSSVSSTRHLIGVIRKDDFQSSELNDKDTLSFSRNALLNMAAEASLTRWTITGLDLENRSTILSTDALFYAQRAASMFSEQYGYVFIIPEFHMLNDSNVEVSSSDETTASISLVELIQKKEVNLITSSMLPSSKHDNRLNTLNDIHEQLYSLWWKDIEAIKVSLHPIEESLLEDVLRLTHNIQSRLNKLLLKENFEMLKHSSEHILMVDRYGPKNGMYTRNLVPDIDELCSCMNMFRLAQFSILNYKVLSLPKVFALSSSWSTDFGTDDTQECHETFAILLEERKRMAKTIIMNS